MNDKQLDPWSGGIVEIYSEHTGTFIKCYSKQQWQQIRYDNMQLKRYIEDLCLEVKEFWKMPEYVSNDFYEQFSEDVEQDAAALEELARHQISEEDARAFRIMPDAGFADE